MRAAEAKALLRSAPIVGFADLVGSAPFLVLAPHADDESLGCGGLIAEACARGHPAYVAILTDGGGSHPNSRLWPRARLVAERRQEAIRAVGCLGMAPAHIAFLDARDSAAPTDGPDFGELVARLVVMLSQHGIGSVFAPWRADPHGDHVAASLLASAACRLVGADHWSYPVWAWMRPDGDDVPDIAARAVRLDIAAHLPRKRRAIAAHATQHGGLIDDDPTGFTLPAEFLACFDGPTEVFIPES